MNVSRTFNIAVLAFAMFAIWGAQTLMPVATQVK